MDELIKRLKELKDKIKAYKELSQEARTDELRDAVDADIKEMGTVMEDIKREERMSELDKFENRTINGDAPDTDLEDSNSIEIDDQPVYRGQFALGAQMRDIVLAGQNGGGILQRDALSRLEQAGKREEVRAAGTGGQVESISADGGYLLQGETSTDLFTKGFNNSALLPLASKRTIGGSKVEIVGIDEDSRADGSRGGGVRVYNKTELQQYTQSKTTFKYIEIEPQKFTGLYFASNEIIEDVPFLTGEMNSLFGEEFSFTMQDQILHGTGAGGQCLGVVNSGCLVSVAKEDGQAADTIVLGNIQNMRMRMWAGASNPVWVTNQNTRVQLQNLALAIGTGGAMVPLYQPATSPTTTATLDGLPILVVEQAPTLGDAHDIMLCDFSQYIFADKGTMTSAESIHLKFDYGQTTFRYEYRADGQPRWRTALTPYKGTGSTVSPFIGLAERA